MLLLLIIVMPMLATLKCVVHGKTSKEKIHGISDVLLFNSYIFFVSGVLSIIAFVRSMPPKSVVLFSFLSALLVTAFQLTYTLAFKYGPVSKISVINSFSMAIPMLVGVLFLGDRLTLSSTIGLVLISFAFVMIPQGKDVAKDRRWLLFTALAFLASGFNNSLMNILARNAELTGYKNMFVAFAYLFGGIFCLIVHLILKKEKCELYADKAFMGSALVCGLCVGGFNLLVMFALSRMSSLVYYPVEGVSSIVMLTLVNSLVFKEKISAISIFGIVLGAVAIVLVNF